MRWRAVGAVLGAATLAAAVAVLRDQAPLPEPPTADAVPSGLAPADGGLPVTWPATELRWRAAVAPAPAFDAIASREHIAYVRTGDGMMTFTVTARDRPDRGPVVEHSVVTSAPWSAVLHDGVLLVAHGRRPIVDVTAIDARTGSVSAVAPPPGHAFRARLAVLGDEVLAAGRPSVGSRACVIALRPRAGESRVVWCSSDDRLATSLHAGEHSALWPSAQGPPGRCARWSRLPEGAPEPAGAAVPAALCAGRAVVDAGGWLVGLRGERDAGGPAIVAVSGGRTVRLGAASNLTPCGRHVYWTAQGDAVGAPAVVYRWRPGAGSREIALTSADAIGDARCTDGVLSVTIARAGGGSHAVEVRTLGRP